MKKRFVPPFVFAVLAIVAAVSAVVQIGRQPQAQNQTNAAALNLAERAPLASGTPVVANKNDVIVVPRKTVARKSLLASVSGRNLDCRNNLIWAFGGRAQRGWYLYEALIDETLTDDSIENDDFASAVTRWQQRNGVEPNGVLDEITLAAVIKFWQSNRLKARGYPSPDELVTAPASDFWDAARPAEQRQVERETFAAYKKMVAAAAADKSLNLAANSDGSLAANEKYLKIVSAFRSREHQARLRAALPNAGRAALAVNSPHFTGRALDIYVGGEPVETKDANRLIQVQTPVYKWLVKNARKFGFKPYFYEPWHWEYAPDESVSATAN